MKKLLLYCTILYVVFIFCFPVFAKQNELTIEQKREINTFGDSIEYYILHKNNAKACFLAYEMIQRYPQEPDAYFSYAKASYHAGYPDRAIEYYNKCILLDKTYYQAYSNIGFIKLNKKKYKEAIKYYTKVINMTSNNKYKKDNAIAYSNRALAKYYDNSLKSSLKDYNKSLSIMSDYKGVDHVYFNRGLCRYDLGDKNGADEDFNTATKLNPRYKYIYYDKRG